MDPWEDSRDDPLLGSVLEDRYRVIECVGVGGMGRVYRARHESSVVGRDVAIKVLDTSSLQSDLLVRRFENEAKILAELRHPNTLKLIDSGRLEDGRLFIVTELLRGEALDDVLARGPLPVRTTIEVLSQVCDSLAEAHACGVIHRDLKPGNIFLERVGEQTIVRVLDFGIAKLVHQPGLTAPLQIFGTPTYMSPEQATGGAIDARADIYALGVVGYECLVGRPPFMDQFPMSVIRKHVVEPPVPVREALRGSISVDPELAALIDRMLEKAPNLRPQRIQDVREALSRAQRRITGGLLVPDLATDLVLAPPEEVLAVREALSAAGARSKRDPSRDTTPDPGEFDDRTPIAASVFEQDPAGGDHPEGELEPTVTSPLPEGAARGDDVVDAPSLLTTRHEAHPSRAPFVAPARAPSDHGREGSTALLAAALEHQPLPLREPATSSPKLSSATPQPRVDRAGSLAADRRDPTRGRRRLKTYEVMLLLALVALLAVAAAVAKAVLKSERAAPEVGVRQHAPDGPKALAKTGTSAAELVAAVPRPTAERVDAGARALELVGPTDAGAPTDAAARRAQGVPSVREASRDPGGPDAGRERAKVTPPPGFIDVTE